MDSNDFYDTALVSDAIAIEQAALQGDYQEMCFRTHRLAKRARHAGYAMRCVGNLSRQLSELLIPPGDRPDSGEAPAIRRVSAELVIATAVLRTLDATRP